MTLKRGLHTLMSELTKAIVTYTAKSLTNVLLPDNSTHVTIPNTITLTTFFLLP